MKMNRKLIISVAVLIIAVTAVCLIAFSGKNEPGTPAPSEGQPVTVNLEPETTEEPFFKPSYDKKITVTLPVDVVDEKYGDDLEAFAEAKGYFSIEKKGEDRVKIKMREYSYRLLLTTVGMDTVSSIGYIMDSGDYPYIDDLAKYNDDFTDIIFTVDKKDYEKAENRDEFFDGVAYCCLYYQQYTEKNKGVCKITVCEKDSNVLIETREITEEELK